MLINQNISNCDSYPHLGIVLKYHVWYCTQQPNHYSIHFFIHLWCLLSVSFKVQHFDSFFNWATLSLLFPPLWFINSLTCGFTGWWMSAFLLLRFLPGDSPSSGCFKCRNFVRSSWPMSQELAFLKCLFNGLHEWINSTVLLTQWC